SVAYARTAQKCIIDRGFGLFAVERKDTNEFIGFTGIHVLEADDTLDFDFLPCKNRECHLLPVHDTLDFDFLPCIEIGWRLQKKHWNQGFATEAARGVLKFVERQTDIKEVYAYTAVRNIPSINIMEKIGMEPVQTFD